MTALQRLKPHWNRGAGIVLLGGTLGIVQAQAANHPPVAFPGGPYILAVWTENGNVVGNDLVLDGSGSSDADAPSDRIIQYSWDLDNDMDFTDVISTSPSTTIPWSQLIQIIGTPSPGMSFPISLEVMDSTLLTSQPEQTQLLFRAKNLPPVLTTIGNKDVGEGEHLDFMVYGYDPNGDVLTFRVSNLPFGAIFDPTSRLFSWTPTFDQAGSYPNVLFTLVDGGMPPMQASEAITITVGNVNRPPVLAPIGNQSILEGKELRFTVSGSDPDGNPLTYSASNLPAGASFEPGTQTFAWTPAYGQSGAYTDVRFTVTDQDPSPMQATEAITITVGSVNRPPVMNTIGDKTVNEGETLTFVVSASDPDGNQLTYAAANLPPGATFDSTSQVFQWTPTYDQAKNWTDIEFTVTDNGLPMELAAQLVTINVNNVNRAPVFTPVGTQQVQEGERLRFNVQASDYDGNSITYSTGPLPSGATFDPAQRLFSWMPDNTEAGNCSVLFKATDDGTPPMTGQLLVAIVVGDAPTPCELSAQLIDTVSSLKLAKAIENSYFANLKKICGFVESGAMTPAVNQVNAFVKKVEADLRAGSISRATAEFLLSAATTLLNRLQS